MYRPEDMPKVVRASSPTEEAKQNALLGHYVKEVRQASFFQDGKALGSEMIDAEVAQMRATYAPPHPHASQLHIIDATAEATTLPDRSVELIAIGRAFHWFDKDRALAECRRILKPSGWMALLAIDRDRELVDPAFRDQINDFEALLSTHGMGYAGIRSGYRSYEKMDMFLDAEIHQEQLHGTRPLDWDNFRGHTMSLSVAPQAGNPNHEAFMHELRRYFDTYASAGILTIPTICWITAGRFADQKP